MFFGSHKGAEFNSISAVRMCEWSRGDVMTPQCEDSVKNKYEFLDLPCLNGVISCDKKKRSKSGILSAFLRLCNISVDKFQCYIPILQYFS